LIRTHRERKEAYTASLESEVVQLRANEARLLQETKTVYSEVAFLRKLLVDNGIAIPERSGVISGEEGRGENVESEKRITLTIEQDENKKKNRRKQIYIQQMPTVWLRKYAESRLRLAVANSFLLMVITQPARRSSLLRRFLALRYQATHPLLHLIALQYVWVISIQRSWGWTLS
jgi:hypothetical protein